MFFRKRKPAKIMYACGVDWQHELGYASDLEGRMPIYSSIEGLKKRQPCWEECGIIEIRLRAIRWAEPQDLFGKRKP